MKSLIIHSLSTALLAALVLLIGEPRQVIEAVCGSALMGANLALVGWVTKRIMAKKSVALAMFVIVSKYAVLLGTLVYLTSIGVEIGFPFAIGIGAVFPTIAFLGYQFMKSGEANDSL